MENKEEKCPQSEAIQANNSIAERLHTTVLRLSEVTDGEEQVAKHSGAPLPSVEALKKLIEVAKYIIFPGFFDKHQVSGVVRSYYIGLNVAQLNSILQTQIARGLVFGTCDTIESVQERADELAIEFVSRLPKIKSLLYSDIEAMCHNDPAVKSSGEVVFCYPMVQVMIHHRIAHELLVMGVPLIPRILGELAHSATGIDIHPGAQIGDHFCIDHGTGVVVGETCIIGSHVMLYQGVTLGAKSFTLDESGVPMNLPRHPIIEDRVTIYSNTSILGRITIGHDSVIGGNVWQTRSVPPHSLIIQGKTVGPTFIDGAGI